VLILFLFKNDATLAGGNNQSGAVWATAQL